MNKIITHLDLDLASSNEYKVINAQQLDNNTRRLEVNLFHEGKIYDITNVTKIELQGFRGDGETIKTPLTNDGNNIIVDFDNTILGAKGICKLKIALFGEDNKLLSSFPFVIRIDQNVYDETGVIASPVYLELENELKNIEDLKVSNFILKEDKDVAGGVPSLDSNTKVPIAELYEATTTRKGITQLTDSVTSASTTTAATPNSVKTVNDSLNSEISRAKSAESTLTTNLNNEITRAKSAENDLDSKKVDKTTVATSTTLGLVKSGTDITVDTSGNVSVNDNSHKHNVSNISGLTATASELNVLDGITATTTELNYTDGVTSNIQTQLNSKSSNGHTHDDRYYTESEIDTTVTDINSSISSHTSNTSNPHSVTKAQVGLGNVENKSSATIRGEITKSDVTTALGYTPLNQLLKGSANGLAELDSNGKVPSSQLPSFVDDVVEGYLSGGKFYKESAHTTEISGESGKIYIDLSTEKTYRWSGSTFVVISETLALGETSSTAYRGDRGKIAYDHSQTAHAPSNAQQNVQSDWNATSGDAFIKNKPTIPTKVGELTNDKDYATKTEVTKAIDDIEIGGRNLLLNTQSFETPYTVSNPMSSGTLRGSMDKTTEQYRNLTVRGGATITTHDRVCEYIFTEFNLGDTFTFSFYAKGNIESLYAFFYGETGYVEIAKGVTSQGLTAENNPDGNLAFKITSDWQRYWVTWTLKDSGDVSVQKRVLLRTDGSNIGKTIYVCGCKLEKGNKATDWTPAIEDTEEEIQSVDNKLTTNMLKPTLGTTTQNGVTCTNNGDGTYTLNGTATNDVIIKFYTTLKAGTYKFIGTPPNIESTYCRYWLGDGIVGDDDGEGFVRTLTKTTTLSFNLYVKKEYTVNNVIFKLMVTTNLNATYDDFVPYTGNTGQINSDVAEIRKDFDSLKKSVSDGKSAVASAITSMGVSTASDATFGTIANNVRNISKDATAVANAIQAGKTAYVNGSKVTGTYPCKAFNAYTSMKDSDYSGAYKPFENGTLAPNTLWSVEKYSGFKNAILAGCPEYIAIVYKCKRIDSNTVYTGMTLCKAGMDTWLCPDVVDSKVVFTNGGKTLKIYVGSDSSKCLQWIQVHLYKCSVSFGW